MYRLTIVNGWNNEEIDAYANLVNIGKPDFIEVKVTFDTTKYHANLSINASIHFRCEFS